MGKFTIICPNCGTANQASDSLFAKKTIKCATCKNSIDTKASRLISKICPECGNAYVCDQSKMKGMKCPFCGTQTSTLDATAEYKYVTVTCPQCGCRVEADKTKPMSICPLCDCQIDVQKTVASEKLTKDGAISVIKYEGDNSSFVWKHPIEDFNFGSQLIVHNNQEAVFFLNGEALDTFGPGKYTLETENIPLLNKVYKIPTGGQNPFHAEVYYVNMSVQMALKWGTPDRVRFIEPESGIPLNIGASGEMNMNVIDSRRLLTKLVGTMKGIDWSGAGSGYTQSIKSSFRGVLITEVKSYLASIIKEEKLNIFEIDSQLSKLSEALLVKIKPRFEEYGLTIPEFFVTNILLPEDNPDFVKLKALKSEAYLGVQDEAVKAMRAKAAQERKMIEAQTEANLRRIEAMGEADATKAMGFADAEVMRAKGYTHKDEIEAEVQKSYAAGMGQFGSNSGSGQGGGGGVASDMMNMMMGMKVAGMMTDKLDGVFNPSAKTPAAPVAPAAAPEAGWNCTCGTTGITGKFCPECGKPKPAPAELWDCECGAKGIKGKFCPECGKPKPAPAELWDCECGAKGIKGKFCPECGKPKPAPAELWDCECGAKGIKGKFCPECGKPKPAPAELWDCECGVKGIKGKFCPECGNAKK